MPYCSPSPNPMRAAVQTFIIKCFKKELTVAQWCYLSPRFCFRDLQNICGFGLGHPMVPQLAYFAHIDAKYLSNIFFPYVPDSSQTGSANPKLWQRLRMLGKGLVTATSRRNWARRELPCFLKLLPTVPHIHSL